MDLLTPLMQWVESGMAPDKIIASHTADPAGLQALQQARPSSSVARATAALQEHSRSLTRQWVLMDCPRLLRVLWIGHAPSFPIRSELSTPIKSASTRRPTSYAQKAASFPQIICDGWARHSTHQATKFGALLLQIEFNALLARAEVSSLATADSEAPVPPFCVHSVDIRVRCLLRPVEVRFVSCCSGSSA